MKNTMLYIAALCCACGSVQAQTPDVVTVKLRYQPFANIAEAEQVGWAASRYIQLANQKTKGWRIPGETDIRPFYSIQGVLDDKAVVMALGSPAKGISPVQYQRLWIDWNHDGKFEPNEAFKRTVMPHNPYSTFGPLRVPAKPNEPNSSIWLQVYSASFALMLPAGMYVGEANLGERTVKVGVVNPNSMRITEKRGNYSVQLYTPPMIAADLNDDGDFVYHGSNGLTNYPAESWPEGVVLQTGERKFWQTAVNKDCSLTLTLIKTPMGTLKIGDGRGSATIRGNGTYYLELKDGTVQVPTGKYSLYQARCTERAPDNSLWSFDMSLNNVPNGSALEVRTGEMADIKCGPPFVGNLQVQQLNNRYIFSFQTTDNAGYAVSGIYGPLGERPKAPELTIKENDKLIKTDTFAYG